MMTILLAWKPRTGSLLRVCPLHGHGNSTQTMFHGLTAGREAHVSDKLQRDGAQHAESGKLREFVCRVD